MDRNNLMTLMISQILQLAIPMTVAIAVAWENVRCFPPTPDIPTVAIISFGYTNLSLTALLNRLFPSASLAAWNSSVSVAVSIFLQSLAFAPHPNSLILRVLVALLNGVIVAAALFWSHSLAVNYRNRKMVYTVRITSLARMETN